MLITKKLKKKKQRKRKKEKQWAIVNGPLIVDRSQIVEGLVNHGMGNEKPLIDLKPKQDMICIF